MYWRWVPKPSGDAALFYGNNTRCHFATLSLSTLLKEITNKITFAQMRRDIDGLGKDLMLLEGRLQRSLVKKAQYIYANLQDKFGGMEKKEDGEDDGSASDGSGLAESILAMQGVKRNEKRLIAMGQRMKELEARDKKREESIKALDSELDDLRDAIKDVLVVEKHKTVRQLRADVDALQRKIKVRVWATFRSGLCSVFCVLCCVRV